MFEFFKKKLPDDFFRDACDMHCHILPGVDDGFQTESASFEALKYLEQKGFRKVRLTPHFMNQYAGNTKPTILEKFELFKRKAALHTSIELSIGAEYMLDDGFEIWWRCYVAPSMVVEFDLNGGSLLADGGDGASFRTVRSGFARPSFIRFIPLERARARARTGGGSRASPNTWTQSRLLGATRSGCSRSSTTAPTTQATTTVCRTASAPKRTLPRFPRRRMQRGCACGMT